MEILSVRAGRRKEWRRVVEAGENTGGGRDGTEGCEPKGNRGGGYTKAVRSRRKITSSEDTPGVD